MNDRIVTFLYVLMRDHTTPGVVEDILQNHAEKQNGPVDLKTYSNQHLAKYAIEIARRLNKRNVKPSVKKQEAARRAGKVKLEKRGLLNASETPKPD